MSGGGCVFPSFLLYWLEFCKKEFSLCPRGFIYSFIIKSVWAHEYLFILVILIRYLLYSCSNCPRFVHWEFLQFGAYVLLVYLLIFEPVFEYFVTFYCPVVSHCMDILHFVYPFTDSQTFRISILWPWWIVLLGTLASKSLCGIAGLCGKFIFNFQRNCQTVL